MVTGSVPALGRKTEAALHCVDMNTGKKLRTHSGVGEFHASLMRTGDSKLLVLEEAGDLVLLDPDPKQYRELARARVCAHTRAHAAAADGRLYLRDDRELICVQLAK